jgi:hypothetical protein
MNKKIDQTPLIIFLGTENLYLFKFTRLCHKQICEITWTYLIM